MVLPISWVTLLLLPIVGETLLLYTRKENCVLNFLFVLFIPCAATPVNLMALRADLAEVSLQIDAEEELFVRKGVAIKYLRKALKKKEADVSRLRQAVDSRDREIMNLSDRMDSVYRILSSGASRLE